MGLGPHRTTSTAARRKFFWKAQPACIFNLAMTAPYPTKESGFALSTSRS